MLANRFDQIHLWFAYVDEIQNLHLLHRYRNLLTEEERQQEKRFHFMHDQRRYLITRALVRAVLSQYVEVTPDQWLFTKNAYGRPEIAYPDVASKIAFNLSHTKNLIVLGVTRGDTLGVDVENVELRNPPLDLASAFFSPNEVADLVALPTEAQSQRFFQYWTLKEAYVKARGMGLSIPLDQFEFAFTKERQIKFSTHSSLNDRQSRWHFWQFQPSKDHLLAVCAERFEGAKPEFVMRKIVPLEDEQFISCPMLCLSA